MPAASAVRLMPANKFRSASANAQRAQSASYLSACAQVKPTLTFLEASGPVNRALGGFCAASDVIPIHQHEDANRLETLWRRRPNHCEAIQAPEILAPERDVLRKWR
jgi:hypothetical protein